MPDDANESNEGLSDYYLGRKLGSLTTRVTSVEQGLLRMEENVTKIFQRLEQMAVTQQRIESMVGEVQDGLSDLRDHVNERTSTDNITKRVRFSMLSPSGNHEALVKKPVFDMSLKEFFGMIVGKAIVIIGVAVTITILYHLFQIAGTDELPIPSDSQPISVPR